MSSDDRYDHFVTDKVDDFPHGYPRLAAFVSSDAEGHMYRRFGYLRSRLLLYYQDEICCLEDELAKLDKEHEESDPIRLNSRRYDEREGEKSERKDLIRKLDERLEHYDKLMLRKNSIMRIPQSPRSLHRQYFNWIYNEKPLVKAEYSFIYRQDDFASLGVVEDGWLGPFIKELGRMMPEWLLKIVLGSKKDEQRSSDELYVFSDSKTQKFVKAIVGIVSSLMLLLPVVVFYLLAMNDVSYGGQIGVLCGFVVAFNTALLTMTSISRHELFAASAAYCAVLVVFLGNLPTQNNRSIGSSQ